MNQEEIKKLAIECGGVTDLHVFSDYELAAYTAAVEAPLQSRIAQLEEALEVANEYMPIYGRNEEVNKHIDTVNNAIREMKS